MYLPTLGFSTNTFPRKCPQMACDLPFQQAAVIGVTQLACFSPPLFSAQCCLSGLSAKSWFFLTGFHSQPSPYTTPATCTSG